MRGEAATRGLRSPSRTPGGRAGGRGGQGPQAQLRHRSIGGPAMPPAVLKRRLQGPLAGQGSRSGRQQPPFAFPRPWLEACCGLKYELGLVGAHVGSHFSDQVACPVLPMSVGVGPLRGHDRRRGYDAVMGAGWLRARPALKSTNSGYLRRYSTVMRLRPEESASRPRSVIAWWARCGRVSRPACVM